MCAIVFLIWNQKYYGVSFAGAAVSCYNYDRHKSEYCSGVQIMKAKKAFQKIVRVFLSYTVFHRRGY